MVRIGKIPQIQIQTQIAEGHKAIQAYTFPDETGPIFRMTGINKELMKEYISGSWKKIAVYVLVLAIILLIISIFIHYLVTPIYKTRPGKPGVVLIPGYDDGVLYWQSQPSELQNDNTILSSSSFNYTLLLDIFIQQPLSVSKTLRVIFHRGDHTSIGESVSKGASLIQILKNYNLAVALLPDTNDLIVSVLNSQNNMENSIIRNVPVQTSFRLGIVLTSKMMEVYMNGNLVQSRPFIVSPKHVLGNFFPPEGPNANVAMIRNLHLWTSLLTPSEIKEASPSLWQPTDIPPAMSPSCSSPLKKNNEEE